MKGEIPVCTRCCFCLPLRYGLLAWGYINLIADAFIILTMVQSLIYMFIYLSVYLSNEKYMNSVYIDIGITITSLIVFVTDFVVTIVFIVGGHKKNVKLMRVFYFFSIAMWILTILFIATAVSFILIDWLGHVMSFLTWRTVLQVFSAYFVIWIVQSYLLLLLRSEIIKLRNNCEFRFVNNAAESECTMNKVEGADEERDAEECETKEEHVTRDAGIIRNL